MRKSSRTRPPWNHFDDMVREYRARLSTGPLPYDLFYYKDAAQYERKLAEYGALLRGLGESVGALLDVGCGVGELLRYYVPRQDYLGVDLVPDFVAIAQKTFPAFKFITANIIDYDLPKCDTAVLVGVLGASPRPIDLLLRMSELARTHFLFDYLPNGGSAAKAGWLRTISPTIVADILVQNGWAVVRELKLGTSTSLLVCARMK